jgi:hypothetical protein
MAVVPDKRRFQKGNIGVVNSNAGGQNVWEGVANLASTVSKNEFEINAEKAKQSGFDLASEMDRSKIISIDPDTGKPVALSFTKGFGRIQEATYNDVIYKRFQNHMKDEILNVSADVAKRSGYNPDVYARNMGDYLDSMDKASKGRYKGYIADTGFEVISKTSENLRVKAQSAAIASAKKAAESNADTALDDLMDAAIVASQPGMSLVNYSDATDPRKPLERIDLGAGSGVRYFERNAGFYSYGNAVKAFTVSMNEELTITGDAKKYVARKNSLSESFGHVAFSYVNDSFGKSSSSNRDIIIEAVNNRLSTNLVQDPSLRFHIRAMHDILDPATRNAMESQLRNSDASQVKQDSARLKAQQAALMGQVGGFNAAVAALNTENAGAEVHALSLDTVHENIIGAIVLSEGDATLLLNAFNDALALGAPAEGVPLPVRRIMEAVVGLEWKHRRDLISRLDAAKEAIGRPEENAKNLNVARINAAKNWIETSHSNIKTILDIQENENRRPLTEDEKLYISRVADETNRLFQLQTSLDSDGNIDADFFAMVKESDFSAEVKDKASSLRAGLGQIKGDKASEDARQKLIDAGALRAQVTENELLSNKLFNFTINEKDLPSSQKALNKLRYEILRSPYLTASNRRTILNDVDGKLKEVNTLIGGNAQVALIKSITGYNSDIAFTYQMEGIDAASSVFEVAIEQLENVEEVTTRNGLRKSLEDTFNNLVIEQLIPDMQKAGLVVGSIEPSRFNAILNSVKKGSDGLMLGMSPTETSVHNVLRNQLGLLKGETDSRMATWSNNVTSIYEGEYKRFTAANNLANAVDNVQNGTGTEKDRELIINDGTPFNLNAVSFFNLLESPIYGNVLVYAERGIMPKNLQEELLAVVSGGITDEDVIANALKLIGFNPNLANNYGGKYAAQLRNAWYRFNAGESASSSIRSGSYEAAIKFVDETYLKEYPDMSRDMVSLLVNISSLYPNPTKEKVDDYIASLANSDSRVISGEVPGSGGLIFSVQTVHFRPLSDPARARMDADVNSLLVEAYPHLADRKGKKSYIDWHYRFNEKTNNYNVVWKDQLGVEVIGRNNGVPILVSTKDYMDVPEEIKLARKLGNRLNQQLNSNPLTLVDPKLDAPARDMITPKIYSNQVTQGMSDAYFLASWTERNSEVFKNQEMAALLRQTILRGFIEVKEFRGISDAETLYLAGGLSIDDFERDKLNGFAPIDGDSDALLNLTGRKASVNLTNKPLGEIYSGAGEVLEVANATLKAALKQIYSDGLKVWEEAVKFDTMVGNAVDEKAGEIFAKAVAFDTAVGDAVDAKVLEVWEKAAAFDKSVGDAVDEKAREIWEASGGDAVLQAYNDSKSKAQARREGGPPPPDGKNKGKEIPAAIDSVVEWWNDSKITSQHRRLLQKHPEAVTYRTREDYEAAVSRGMVSDGAEVIVGLDYFIHSGGR